MIVNTEGRIPIKMWIDTIEEEALAQAINVSNLPFTFKHVAIMPDAHTGMGVSIGSVFATQGVVVPNAVGVDIGCGMCAVKTPWKVDEISEDVLKKILGKIRAEVPVGFAKHVSQSIKDISQDVVNNLLSTKELTIVDQEWKNAVLSLGSLGGGNHFIEIQKDDKDNVWIMIHSGSRNLGKKVADYYDKRAQFHNKLWHSGVPTSWRLAYLPIDTDDGRKYMEEMNYCVAYAFANRRLMMERIANAFNETIRHKKIDLDFMINIAHNYARLENHFGVNVLVHRKGATSAKYREIGIIPGSQGTASYIVKGLGNAESFTSCSHGAGRVLSRSMAKKTLDLATEQKRLDDQGIIHNIRNLADLDEASGAYKDIDVVMNNQKDLVEIVTALRPIAVIKG